MRAVVTTVTRGGAGKVKSIGGKVLQRGLGVITLMVPTKDGGYKIRRFDESKYTVTVYE